MTYSIKELFLILIFETSGYLLPQESLAQETGKVTDNLRRSALNFFLDCRSCDLNYTRQEIPFVNYVRDTHEAEVYLLISSQNAGSGGNQYTFFFQGLGKFEGMNDTLVYTSSPDETNSVIREKKTNLMKIGLMRYVAHTPVFSEIEIKNNSNLKQKELIDRWDNWVFELQTNPHFSAEESYKRLSFYNSVGITKITPDLKLEIRLNQFKNKQKYIEDDVETEYIRKEKSVYALFVKSLGNHWSTGLKWQLGASTNENYDLSTEFLPSVEYDLYPYSEATHRQFRFLYSAGYQYSNYIDSSIFNKTREGRYKHELSISYQIQKKWGSINVSLSGSNYFYDLSKNKLELWGFTRLRIIKGLSISINGGVAYINDQLNLSKGDLSEAERLLRLKEQATNFSVQGGVSLTYTFGSIYNNVVNPRFGNGGT
jgi:hypothetical protein